MATMAIISAMSHVGVVVWVDVSLSVLVCSCCCRLWLVSVSVVVCTLAERLPVVVTAFCCPRQVVVIVVVVRSGYCCPSESGADQSVTSVCSVRFSWTAVWSSVRLSTVCVAALSVRLCVWVASLVCRQFCCFSVAFWLLQLTAHRAISSMRAIVDFLHGARELADIFA